MTPERKPAQLSLEEITRIAREVILRDGMHVPTVMAQGSKGMVIAQLQEMPDTHEKRLRAMFAAGLIIAQKGEVGTLNQVFFVSEGWMSFAEKDGTVKVPPSQDPRRKEVLVVDGLEVESYQNDLVVFEMLRDSDGRLADLKPMEHPGGEGGRAESPLLDAFVQGFRAGRKRFH